MIFCVSDLHAGDRGARDNFCYDGREDRFYDFLDWVDSQRAELFILGDLFDFWQMNLSASILAYRDLLDRFEDMQATYVVGNHDSALIHFIGTEMGVPHPFFKRMTLPFERVIAGRKFAFLHGHEADPYCNRSNPGTGEITTIISGMLEDRNHSPFQGIRAVEDEFVGTLENALSFWRRMTFQAGRQGEMVNGVESYRKSMGADAVVSGHTHEPGRIGDWHFNSGTWARQIDTFVKIDDYGRASLGQWKDGAWAAPFDRLLR